MKRSKRLLGLTLASVSFLTAGLATPVGTVLAEEKFIAAEDQTNTHFIAIVKLKRKPLLSFIDNQNKKLKDRKVKKLLQEQAKFLQELKEISSEIKVLYKYRMVLNGVAILAPKTVEDKIRGMAGVSYVEHSAQFGRPVVDSVALENEALKNAFGETTIDFLGATRVHQGIRINGETPVMGQGVEVGIIDTGIDYTHAMFGGPGDAQVYKDIDASKDYPQYYPNAKVVGGIDLVGTEYNASTGNFKTHIPKPDNNPIDEGSHGTHVAGTVAGLGDGVNTFSGGAPQALLHAIKVFGKRGSTGDAPIVAALEYAADPNKDFRLDDQLDVVNMSLGSGYGKPHILYAEAIRNLSNAGTMVVASAGNSGHEPYIVGAPGSTDEAISVAASIDNMDHNWKFKAVEFTLDQGETLLTEAIEGSITKPIAQSPVEGKLVYAGVAAEDFSEELKEQLKGHVALIDRGAVTFSEKIKRAEGAGAIGVIVANNRAGGAIAMGGDGKFGIPGIMVTQEAGNKLKASMKNVDTIVKFQTDKKMEKPELIDTLTGFSSRGPRSNGSRLKPEISSPGSNIISASAGSGDKGRKMSGTSMAAPNLAGVAALLRQKFPELAPKYIKALIMNHAKSITNAKGETYPVGQQGAGRVQAYESANAQFLAYPSGISLGEMKFDNKFKATKSVKIKNLLGKKQKLTVSFDSPYLEAKIAKKSFKLKKKSDYSLPIKFSLRNFTLENEQKELEINGHLTISNGEQSIRVPVLGMMVKYSKIKAKLRKNTLKLNNKSLNNGVVEVFNLLGKDESKPRGRRVDRNRSRECDLKSAGYRIVEVQTDKGPKSLLQIGVKLKSPVTRWQGCEVSVQFDKEGDGVAEQELVATLNDNIPGASAKIPENGYSSFLIDSKKAREIRLKFEKESIQNPGVQADYWPAVVAVENFIVHNHSTVAVMQVELDKIVKTDDGDLQFKLGVFHEEGGAIQPKDFLKGGMIKMPATSSDAPFMNLPQTLTLKGKEKVEVELEEGTTKGKLLVLMPFNRPGLGQLISGWCHLTSPF